MATEVETYRGAVYPWHCDTMGHMNTQFYTAIFDSASFHMLSRLVPYSQMQARKHGWADVKMTVVYEHETPAGALVHVRSTLTRLGSKAIEYRHSLLNSESGVLHATADIVTVLFDLTARKALPIDDAIRAKGKELGLA